MGRFALPFAATILTAGLVTQAGATNVVSNPGFETGGLLPWVQARDFNLNNGPHWSVTGTNPNSGSFAATAGDDYELRQDFPGVWTPDISSVTFSAVTPAMAFDLFYSGGGDDEFFVIGDGTSWQSYNVTSDLRPGSNLVAISFFGNSAATVLLDDVAINAPEPTSLALLGFSMAGLGFIRRRR